MSTFLNIDEIQPTGQALPTTATPEQTEKAKNINKLGVIALLLTIFAAFIPLLGTLMIIA